MAVTAPAAKPTPDRVTIKKYANRRLYNTASSSYVTLDALSQMVREGIDFAVFDAKTGEDITRAVLTQIIVEEESKGRNLLPIGFLRQLIAFYGDSMQWAVPAYLDHAMTGFIENQEKIRGMMQDVTGGMFPFKGFEEMGKQNLDMFEKTMRMFTPLAGDDASTGAMDPNAPMAATFQSLYTQMQTMQEQLQQLSKAKSED